MPSFTERLRACIKQTDMTVSDLSRWFGRPRATVNTWINGRTPFGPQARSAILWLERLELSIKDRSSYYPIPEDYDWPKREAYVKGMRDDAERNYRVSSMRATG